LFVFSKGVFDFADRLNHVVGVFEVDRQLAVGFEFFFGALDGLLGAIVLVLGLLVFDCELGDGGLGGADVILQFGVGFGGSGAAEVAYQGFEPGLQGLDLFQMDLGEALLVGQGVGEQLFQAVEVGGVGAEVSGGGGVGEGVELLGEEAIDLIDLFGGKGLLLGEGEQGCGLCLQKLFGGLELLLAHFGLGLGVGRVQQVGDQRQG